jgi:hypothetical protein
MRDRDPPEEKEGVLKKHALSLAEGARPVLRPLEGKAAPLGRAERTEEYVSTAKGRPACTLARRSASARRREAAPAKAGNAAGLPAEPTPPK